MCSAWTLQLANTLEKIGWTAVPEIYYYLTSISSKLSGILDLGSLDRNQLRSKFEHLVSMSKSVRKYECITGYKVRFGISQLHLAPDRILLRLEPNLKISNCEECWMPVAKFANSQVHILSSKCNKKRNDEPRASILEDSSRKYILYSNLLLGVYDTNDSHNPSLSGFLAGTARSKPEYARVTELARQYGIIDDFSAIKISCREVVI